MAYIVVVACVLWANQLVYSFIEEPFRKISRRYAARRFAAREAVASPEICVGANRAGNSSGMVRTLRLEIKW